MRDLGSTSSHEVVQRAGRNKRVSGIVIGIVVIAAAQLALQAGPLPVEKVPHVPPGTVISVKLEDAFEVALAHAQHKIEARVAQEVPLVGGQKVSLRARVAATVLSVNRSQEGPVSVSLKFDQLEDKEQTSEIAASVRAMASYQAVRNALTPLAGAEGGTPGGWGTTVQIGGDIRYGDGGKVKNRQKQTVGKGVRGGVLVHIAANEEMGCDGPAHGGDRPQATWVFSAAACGVYDLKNVKMVHNGRSDPIGVVTLEFAKDDMKLDPGTAFLLRTVARP